MVEVEQNCIFLRKACLSTIGQFRAIDNERAYVTFVTATHDALH